MSDFRQFRLLNTAGAVYDLCDSRHFFASPDGLGFVRSFSTLQTGSAFVAAGNDLQQQTVTGEMVFDGYDEYSDFVAFITGTELTLAYQPAHSENWYYRTCKVSSLKKTEVSSATGRLHCNVDFLCFSQWYEPVIVENSLPELDENSLFPLTFPFTFEDRNINEIVIQNNSAERAPCKIAIAGACSNPRWELRTNGVLVADGKVGISLLSGEWLIVDANVESMRIVKSVNGVETDVYQYSDFSTDRFIYAPSGKSVLSFFHDSVTALTIAVEVRKVADTV